MISFGSVCSGIEAASVAWNPLGFSASWLSEIEPFPSAVLAHHYPDTLNLGDMTAIAKRIRTSDVEAPDVLVGGTPCQTFSVAGLRAGIGDERGQLIFSFLEILDAADAIRCRNGRQPTIAVWENVPGALSSRDNAFGCFLAGLVGERQPIEPPGERWPNTGVVAGPSRAAAWRILDAQYFGLAQRRKRLFVVASARDGFNPAEVLFEFGGVQRHSAPSREAGEATACEAGEGFTAASFGQPSAGVGALRAAGGDSETLVSAYRMAAFGEHKADETASTIKTRDHKDSTDLILSVRGTQDQIVSTDRAHALGRNNGQENVVYAMPGNWIGRKPENGGNGSEPSVNLCPTQTATDRHVVMCPIPINTMTVQGRPSDNTNPRMGSGIGRAGDPQNTLTKGHSHAVFEQDKGIVRRLTPIECERLQGFPDNYTKIPWRGAAAEDCPDGPRYKALGNSMAVPVMRWIGERIARQLND